MWGKLDLVLMGRTMLSKSFIQFSVAGQGCVPSLLFDLRPKYGVMKIMATSFKRSCACTVVPRPCSRPLLIDPSARDFWTLTVKSGVTAPFSWVLVLTRLFLPSKSLFPHSYVNSVINPTGPQSQIPGGFSVPLLDPQVGISVVGLRTFLTV